MTRESFTATFQAAVNAALTDLGITELSRRTGLAPTTIRGAAAGKAPSGYTIASLEVGLGLRPGKLTDRAVTAAKLAAK